MNLNQSMYSNISFNAACHSDLLNKFIKMKTIKLDIFTRAGIATSRNQALASGIN